MSAVQGLTSIYTGIYTEHFDKLLAFGENSIYTGQFVFFSPSAKIIMDLNYQNSIYTGLICKIFAFGEKTVYIPNSIYTGQSAKFSPSAKNSIYTEQYIY